MLQHSKLRTALGVSFLLLAVGIWLPSSDIIELIVRHREVLLGRYSKGHFGSLFLTTLLLLGLSALCFSKIKTIKEMLFVSLATVLSTLICGYLLVISSGYLSYQPRYVETKANNIEGLIRHRQPNQFYELDNIDEPEQLRSYPNAPAGYPTIPIALTIDRYGFRNKNVLESYPLVAVGDSFVAGSHVSDEQSWVSLLSNDEDKAIYNLGVSGSDPETYLNNFLYFGENFSPKIVLFMIYEGNDFKNSIPIGINNIINSSVGETKKTNFSEEIKLWANASPVKQGFKRFSRKILEAIGKSSPVRNYQQQMSWMPIEIKSKEGGKQYYSFAPKRLKYLYWEKNAFKKSSNWKRVSSVMQSISNRGKQNDFDILFVYAPSKPHVILPIIKNKLDAKQLHQFSSYKMKNIPEPKVFKSQVFDRLDNQENIFLASCKEKQFHCLSLTPSLQQAASQNKQVYYTYDQHWTPEGNRVVADVIGKYLKGLAR